MRRPIPLLVLTALILAAPQTVLAQADARQAFEDGKKAYNQGQFDKARDSFLAASRTDNRNPEVFLWLGKAHFQLGEVSKAVAAWQRTLQLAPQEPYAAKMVKALRSELVKVDTRISLIEVMLKERLFSTALTECRKLLADKALTDPQRAKVMTLLADALVESCKSTEAVAAVREVLARWPAHADAAQTTLILGRAKMRMGGQAVAEGLALLRKVLADHKGKPAAATAQYELIVHGLAQKVDAAGAAALKKWVDANATHPSAEDGRKRLIQAYIELSRRSAPPQPQAKLGAFDASAVAVLGDLFKQIVSAKEAGALVGQVLTHVNTHYAKRGAHAAAIDGVTRLLGTGLPASSRQEPMRWLATWRGNLAVKQLSDQAKAGKLPGGAMPKALADTVAAWQAVTRAFPATPAWADQAALAEQVRHLASLVPWPAQVTAPKAPQQWAVQIALGVIRPGADASAVAQAVKTIGAVVGECAKFTKPPARGVALAVHTQVYTALAPDHAGWADVALRQIDLLSASAAAVFTDNLKAGRGGDNAKPSDHQKQLLAAMAKLVGRRADQAPAVLKRLAAHLQRWVQHGHYALAEQAYTQLAAALPAAQRRAAALAVAELWVHEVATRHNQLLSAGLTVPKRLDPGHVKALERCYSLQAGLAEDHAFLKQVRGVWEGVVRHYKSLEYFGIAEQAIQAKPAAAVEAANAYAQLKLADLHYELARRELDEFLKQYGAAEKITLTAAFKRAIADYTKFITDRPTSPMISQAVSSIFSIAQIFEQHRAYDVAAGVYRDFAAFAAKTQVLSQAPPGAVSAAERAEFAVANTLYAKAQQALRKALAARKPDAPPPAKISAEFAAAIAAYKTFIKARPNSALLARAIGQIMAVALEYAKANAWDVADGTYADLLAAGLAIRRPERIELCRGLCQLGKVLPDHAKQVLAALTTVGAPRATGTTVGGLVAYDYENGKKRPGKTGGDRPSRDPKPASPTVPPALPGPGRPKGSSASRTGKLEADSDQADELLKKSDMLAMAAIRKQHQQRAARIAALRDKLQHQPVAQRRPQTKQGQGKGQQAGQQQKKAPSVPVLSEAEIARQEKAFAAAYKIFQAIRKKYPRTATAKQARGEIMVMVSHWRTIAKWQRAAALIKQYLTDNPTDIELPQLRLSMARDTLTWASQPVKRQPSKQAMLAEVARRFTEARAALADIVAKSTPKEKSISHEAQWDIANSFLTQARVVNAFSPTLARGQYVRAAKELLKVAERFHDHPKISNIPQMLWSISQELAGRSYFDEAIIVWNDLTIHHPTHSLAQQAALRIAQTYQNNLSRPLKAAETYLELNFARGGSDQGIQNAILQIGAKLKGEKRWVEALHVLETFVDSFPRHPSAGQALTTVGQIHQTNEAWGDAIAAFTRVINEFPDGTWVREAKWAIAECTINLSRWREAMQAYESFLAAYGKSAKKDPKIAEATRRIGILKDLARYQALVDEKGQRKAFDAQHQIGEIVLTKLTNPVKAIIEYRKVAANWPKSHLADDAMYKIGTAYLSMGEIKKARTALLAVAQTYPNSPLADDALYKVGQSFEQEARKLVAVTRDKTVKKAQEFAQKAAYSRFQAGRRAQRDLNIDRIAKLRKGGKGKEAELEVARGAAAQSQYNLPNVSLFAQQAEQDVEALTAKQLADRQDKMNAALRKAVGAYEKASRVAAADKAGDSLLRMAVIYAENLKDAGAAMKTYVEIVRQFSGTSVAEDASWRIAQNYEKQRQYAQAIDAYKAFLRNYRRSAKAGSAQFAVAENYEHLGKWVDAMDAYTNYMTNFASGPLVQKAKEQINWIKTYRL